MKEFMLLIRNDGEAKASLSAEEHLAFIKKCEIYIDILKSQNKLIAAQPLILEGVIITRTNKEWKENIIVIGKDVQVGYYHILANDINEAISIAKNNPEFEYVASASVEVRPIKTEEKETAFVYPTNV
ncbi:MAG: hypothetical protein O8C66_07555 [Candidatus Methanoperedens sp.]|nr:hypothetical protein [Candidatus Methanoperedens sp.]MCZ7370350.1 hypothetical protein [Candidatus Methanoperedens sp.]